MLQNNSASLPLFILATILIPVLGCDDGVTLAPGIPSPSSESGGAQGEFTLVSMEPVVYDGKGDPRNFDLLADSTFAAFGAGSSVEWQESGNRWEQMAGAPESTDFAESGEGSALFINPDPNGIEIRQTIADLGPVNEGDWLVATMRAIADKRFTLGLVVSFANDGGRIEAAEGHPGDGEWHDIELALPVPRNVTQNVFDCSVVYVGNPDTPAMVKSVRMHLQPRNTDGPENLVVNGDFERYRFTRLPYPWFMDRWNSSGQPVQGGDAVIVQAANEASGDAALSFARPSPSTNVRVSQRILRITPDNAGVTLVAKAIGLASHSRELWLQLRSQKNGRDVANAKKFVIHSGDGQWHELVVELVVPPESVADTVYIDAFRRSFTDEKVEIDNIRVERR